MKMRCFAGEVMQEMMVGRSAVALGSCVGWSFWLALLAVGWLFCRLAGGSVLSPAKKPLVRS